MISSILLDTFIEIFGLEYFSFKYFFEHPGNSGGCCKAIESSQSKMGGSSKYWAEFHPSNVLFSLQSESFFQKIYEESSE